MNINILKSGQKNNFIIFTISKFKKFTTRTNVTWHDAYYQQHDDILKIKSIFSPQMSYPNTKK
jgi:hypothetical protein